MASVAKAIDISAFKSLLADIATNHAYSGACGKVRVVRHFPVLCPSRESTVRFLPLRDHWELVDFTPFEREDFAFAVTRSLLHRGPSEAELARASTCAHPIDKLAFLLDVYAMSRRQPSRASPHARAEIITLTV